MSSSLPVKPPPISVVIAGDAAIDWYEERITHYPDDKDREHKKLPPQNWRLRPGSDWHWSPGGVLLLKEMICKAFLCGGGQVEIAAFPKLKEKPEDVPTNTTRQLIHSLAVIRPDPERNSKEDAPKPKKANPDDQSWRAKKFLGFRGPSTLTSDLHTHSFYSEKVDETAPHIAVLDDAGNGFRDTRDNWPIWLKNLKTAKPRLVVLKLNEPLPAKTPRGRNELWEHLRDAGVPLLAIVNGYDLRREDIELSWRLSWERTVYDIACAMGASNALTTLTEFADVVIRLGLEGAVVVPQRRTNPSLIHLVCDPARIEDGAEGIPSGHVTGLTSAFVTGIVCKLASMLDPHKPLDAGSMVAAAKQGLHCAYRLAHYGIKISGDPGSDNRKLSFPHEHVFKDAPDVDRTLESFPVGSSASIRPLRPSNKSEEKLAREIVVYGHAKIASVPHARFEKLLTADYSEIEALRSIANLFRKYLDDASIEKPLSIAVFGPPGSGKSFAIKSIANSIDPQKLRPLEFNVAEWRDPADLTDALHVARDVWLNGAVPLVFFDEFDAALGNDRLTWLKSFLAPMQDGKFKEKSRQHDVGRAIFVFAGGTAIDFNSFEEYDDVDDTSNSTPDARPPASSEVKPAKSKRPIEYSRKFKDLKGPDFISRLSGYVNIKGLNPPDGGSLDDGYILRRAIILRSQLEKHKSLLDRNGKLAIDEAVLSAFLKVAKFNHGVRSLEAIVRMSSLLSETYHFTRSMLPSDEQLALHVDPEQFLGKDGGSPTT
jgi:hypothetical protein